MAILSDDLLADKRYSPSCLEYRNKRHINTEKGLNEKEKHLRAAPPPHSLGLPSCLTLLGSKAWVLTVKVNEA